MAGELAHHFVAGRDPAGAVHFLRLAADQAFARSAHTEGIDHLRSALRAAERLAPGITRNRVEVELLSQLGQGLVAIDGWSSPEAEETLQRARRLAGPLHDNEPLVSVLLALATLYEVRGEFERARGGDRRVHATSSPTGRPSAAWRCTTCSPATSSTRDRSPARSRRPSRARSSSRAGRSSGSYSTFPSTLGDNAGVACHDWAGLALWYLGYPDQAL